ncbi:hypothetical protein ACFT7S_05730 [Streptomyces sp. NPDC057136]|uniref:hypothetical protein n=1 Tax=Streptomyces sp. NPDC057136 TaxID=3346029 RepID=UPI00362EE1C9
MTDVLSPPDGTRSRPAGHPVRAALGAEFRRGFAPWTGPAVALTLLVTMAAKADQWQGSWGETQSLLHSGATLLTGPLTAAAGCWQGGREHRRRTDGLWLSVPRSRLARLVTAAAPIAVWAVAGYLVALAGTFAATWPYTGAGGPSLTVVLADVCFLVCAAFLGFVAGRVCRWRLTAPVVAAVAYVSLGAPSYVYSDVRFLSPAEQIPFGVPVWWFGPVMAAWLGGLTLALVLGHAARHRFLAVVPLAVAASVAPLIVHTGPDLFRDDPVAARLVCGDTTPQVCVSGLDEPLLPQASEALAGLFSRLEGVPGAPVRYVDPAVRPRGGELALPQLTRGWTVVRNRLVHPDAYATDTVHNLMPSLDCPDRMYDDASAAATRIWDTDLAVQTWLAPGADDGYPPEDSSHLAYVARLTAMPDADRRIWLGRYLVLRGSCDPKEIPVL